MCHRVRRGGQDNSVESGLPLCFYMDLEIKVVMFVCVAGNFFLPAEISYHLWLILRIVNKQ